MKIVLLILIFIGGIVFVTSSCTNKSNEKLTQNIGKKKNSENEKINSKENPFVELRNKAFKVKPEELGIVLSNEETKVFGIIMDWEMGGATASTISYQTGDASLYLSSGGGVIGGGTHPNVKIEAENFVRMAQSYLEKTLKTENNKLPETNNVNFYLLTNKGLYVGIEKIENFENNSSEWLQLFEQGNRVLSELRKISEK